MRREHELQAGSVWDSSKGLPGQPCCGRQHLWDAGGSARLWFGVLGWRSLGRHGLEKQFVALVI